MNGFGYFLAAYILAGGGILAYIIRLWAVHRALRRELGSLRGESQRKRS